MIADGAELSRRLFGETLDPRELLVRCYPTTLDLVPTLDRVVLTARPLVARVNRGLWIASCDCGAPRDKLPTPGGVVFLDRPFIWDLRCQNGGTGRGWRPVRLPPPDVIAAVEAVLLCRPRVEDRNWEPDETMTDLLAQNRAHGDPVPNLDAIISGPFYGPSWQEMVAPFGPIPGRPTSIVGRLLRRVMR